ncbi:hypothetical protein P3T76_003889 [Phytophthora citrophthora]|uniref:Lebercilin domain-containing protein n=1 Tax=Phytophthora citrophthora TaxID=4793 RepID=A0AAD9GVH6_9STRA|nr:hypothetical protein P3T76_003889 [Phytophthora citrophthora]
MTGKGAVRPCSARVVRPMPTECPQFFTDNPVPTRPARPSSARPRMRSTPRSSSDDRTLNNIQFRSNGVGMRRKRQGEKLVHARIRAVYNDVGPSSVAMKHNTTSALSKFKGLKDSEMHDEYYRLLDAESELKATCLQEQQKRMKAVTHVRRLEEIIAMKDKKIESLLHAKTVGADRSLSMGRSVVQRERAERDRQSHALTQKLKQKIAQQSKLLSSYEEAMQSLRSGIKSTSLMELEEERSQLYQELRHHQELLDRQRLEWEVHQKKLMAFADAEARNKLLIVKLQQENKTVAHEKRKLEQEVGFLKSQVVFLRNNLTLEQRKRTYDRDFSDSVGKRTASSPTQKVMLAQALDEMKTLLRRETATSIKREKLKSPEATSFQADLASHAYQSSPTPTFASKIPGGTTAASSSRARAQSASTTPTRPQVAVARKTTTITANSKPDLTMFNTKLDSMTSKSQKQEVSDDHDGTKEGQKPTGVDIALSDIGATLISTNVRQDSYQSESAKTINSSVTGNSSQNPGEELSEVYYQLCNAPQNSMQLSAGTLELAGGEDFDSVSSADLLDDAQHLKSEQGVNTFDSIDDIADAALLSFDLTKNEEVGDTEAPFSQPPEAFNAEDTTQEMTQNDGGQSPETFDDLYAPDFLDTDA